jgi:hypothetical protein
MRFPDPLWRIPRCIASFKKHRVDTRRQNLHEKTKPLIPRKPAQCIFPDPMRQPPVPAISQYCFKIAFSLHFNDPKFGPVYGFVCINKTKSPGRQVIHFFFCLLNAQINYLDLADGCVIVGNYVNSCD